MHVLVLRYDWTINQIPVGSPDVKPHDTCFTAGSLHHIESRGGLHTGKPTNSLVFSAQDVRAGVLLDSLNLYCRSGLSRARWHHKGPQNSNCGMRSAKRMWGTSTTNYLLTWAPNPLQCSSNSVISPLTSVFSTLWRTALQTVTNWSRNDTAPLVAWLMIWYNRVSPQLGRHT